MAAVASRFPSYTSAFVHPGLSYNPDIGKMCKEPSYRLAILSKLTLSRGESQDDIAAKIYKAIREREVSSIDTDVEHGAIYDRDLHEKMVEMLNKEYVARPLASLSKAEVHAMIVKIHGSLFAKAALGSASSDGYRSTQPCVMHNKSLPQWGTREFRSYLEAHDRESVPAYLSMARKTIAFLERGGADRPSLLDEGVFSTAERAVVCKYIHVFPAPREMRANMHALVREIQEDLREGKDPITVAAKAHMGIVNNHPFIDGNGRTARAVMNLILVQSGYPAIAFPYATEYKAAVKACAEDPTSFENYLRQKVEDSVADASDDVREARYHASVVQALWTRIPPAVKDQLAAGLLHRAHAYGGAGGSYS